ncbi:MAG TPA: NTP transferase domain-containing protein [Phycisphaerales bacterium]|nr:NTP transferase domain-containing protein [Phycisphaerales bacterium]HMP37631.1 NTP transferase domain-containing protein [Phycisphaerales bacterium]
MQRLSTTPSLAAVVLAAGKGTRMNSDLPKVAHVAAGRPLVDWVVRACRAAGAAPVVIVVGHRAEDVIRIFAADRRTAGDASRREGAADGEIRFVTQTQQLGTGHAVQQAEGELDAAGVDDVLVLYGDGPLIRRETIETLVDRHRAAGAAATLATAVLDDPGGYGRIVRDERGAFRRIREQRDADASELAIREVNPGYYCFRRRALFDALARVGRGNAGGEIYLTDVFEILLAEGETIEVVAAVPPDDVLSVNTPEQLRAVEGVLRRRGTESALPVDGGARA